MRRRTKQKHNAADQYKSGLNLYANGRHLAAAEKLSQLHGQHDVTGKLARYYEGLAHRSLGIEAMRSGRFRAAERHFRTALECVGRRADLTSYLCSLYASTSKYDACASEMAKAASENGNDSSMHRKLAQAQWRAGRREEAFMTLTSALRQLDDSSEILVQLGLFHAAENRFVDARGYLSQAVETDCTNADIHCYLGLVEAALGRPYEAARSFQRAWELRPQDVMLSFQLALSARASVESGHAIVVRLPQAVREETAESHVKQMANYVQSEPDLVDAFLALPVSEIDEELFGALESIVQLALVEHPEYADLQHRLSCILHRLGRIDLAIEHAEKAIEINPKYVQGLLQLAKLYHHTGSNDEAVGVLNRAIRCGADWPDMHYFAGELLLECKKPHRARTHFEQAIALKADYSKAADALTSLAA